MARDELRELTWVTEWSTHSADHSSVDSCQLGNQRAQTPSMPHMTGRGFGRCPGWLEQMSPARTPPPPQRLTRRIGCGGRARQAHPPDACRARAFRTRDEPNQVPSPVAVRFRRAPPSVGGATPVRSRATLNGQCASRDLEAVCVLSFLCCGRPARWSSRCWSGRGGQREGEHSRDAGLPDELGRHRHRPASIHAVVDE